MTFKCISSLDAVRDLMSHQSLHDNTSPAASTCRHLMALLMFGQKAADLLPWPFFFFSPPFLCGLLSPSWSNMALHFTVSCSSIMPLELSGCQTGCCYIIEEQLCAAGLYRVSPDCIVCFTLQGFNASSQSVR